DAKTKRATAGIENQAAVQAENEKYKARKGSCSEWVDARTQAPKLSRNSMTAGVETIIVGASAVGLAVALTLAKVGREVVVLEQHDIIGSETSSRNSEVIHAGIYYPPGSLRAKLCVEGKAQLYQFCAENGVAHQRITKLLVATSEAQIPKLKAIQETAIRNGVTDLQPLTGGEARILEPEVSCVAALLSPSTGTIDTHAFMLALEGHVEAHGGNVVLNTPVERVGRRADGLFE